MIVTFKTKTKSKKKLELMDYLEKKLTNHNLIEIKNNRDEYGHNYEHFFRINKDIVVFFKVSLIDIENDILFLISIRKMNKYDLPF